MTKKEIKTVAFNLINDYVIRGNQIPNNEYKSRFMASAFTIVEMLAELNMLNDEQITGLKNNITEGIYD